MYTFEKLFICCNALRSFCCNCIYVWRLLLFYTPCSLLIHETGDELVEHVRKGNSFIAGYEYLFYKIYMFMCWPNSQNRGLQYGVLVWIAGFLAANFFTVFGLYDLVTGKQTLSFLLSQQKLCGLILAIAFFLVYFLFIHKEKYRRIISHYKNESNFKGVRGEVFAWVYIFVSMFGLMTIILLKIILNNIYAVL